MNFDRVDSLEKFLNLKNQKVWLVTNPKFQNRADTFGNSFITSWVVGDVYTELGSTVDDINTPAPLYSPHATKNKNVDDLEYKYLLPIHDYNVIPNYNSDYHNAIFYNEQSANEYRVWLMMQYKREELLDLVDPATVYCLMVEWNDFITNGLNFEESLI